MILLSLFSRDAGHGSSGHGSGHFEAGSGRVTRVVSQLTRLKKVFFNLFTSLDVKGGRKCVNFGTVAAVTNFDALTSQLSTDNITCTE